MYFDVLPKTKREDLFGADYALSSLTKYIADRTVRMIIIKGLRRTGKTSLLNVALSECKLDYVKIDVRESQYYDRSEFFKFLINKIKQKVGQSLIESILKSIEGFSLSYEGVSATVFLSKKENLMLFFDRLNNQLKKKNKQFILAFDEVQLLKTIQFDLFLASIFDNYGQIKFILTGSEIGLLDRFIGKKIYKSPLYGRAYIDIVLRKLKDEETTRFLEEGFKQINKEASMEMIRDVIENLDGIIGWATHYGWLRSMGRSHESALEKVKDEGREISKQELMDFLKTRKAKGKYMNVLKYIAHGKNNWSMLKYSFDKEGIKTTDSQLNLYLKELSDYGFIEKVDDKYLVSDPLVAIVVRGY